MTYLAVHAGAAPPPSWRRVRLRYAASLTREKRGARDIGLLSLSARTGVRERDEGGLGRQAPSEDTLLTYWVVRPGDVVVNPMWLLQGGVGVTQLHGAVSPAYRVYRPGPGTDGRYLAYLLGSRPYIDQYNLLTRGITTFDRAIQREDLDDIPLVLPPLDEQQRIADFLDAETARIDRLVMLRAEQMSLGVERARAVLDRTTQDLTRRYGTQPLGRRVLRISQGWSPDCDGFPADEDEWGVVKVGSVKNGQFVPSENKRLPDGLEPRRGLEIRGGDLLLTRANTPALVGDITVVPLSVRRRLLLCDKIFRIRLAPGMSEDFVALVARSSQARFHFSSASTGTSQSMVNIRNDDVRSLAVPDAPLLEQEATVAEVARAEEHRNALTELARRQTALLEDRRRTLVTAAVTGQLDVTTACGVA